MTWTQFLFPLLATFLLLWVPGALVGAALGLRGLWWWATVPAITLGLLGIASVGGPMVGLAWGLGALTAVTLAVLVIAVVLRLALPGLARSVPVAHGRWWAAVIGLAVGGLILAYRLWLIHGTPETISQSYDNIFHLNAVRYILDTSSASPLSVGGMTGISFYPALWHGVAAMVVQLTGAPITVGVNAVTFVVGALIWPAGIALLTRTLVGARPVAVVTAGVLAAALPTYPFLLLQYGVLYPYFAALSLLPVALALTLTLARIGTWKSGPSWLWSTLLLGVALLGMTLTHPGAFVAWLALSVPSVLVLIYRLWRSRGILPSALALVAYVVLGVVALRALRPDADDPNWPTDQTIGQAVGEVVTVSPYGMPIAWAVALLTIVGIVAAARKRRETSFVTIAMWFVGGFLFVVVSAATWQRLRWLLTSPWYCNPPRLAALLPFVIIPLASLGALAVAHWLRTLSERWLGDRRPTWRTAVAGTAGVLALVLVTQGAAIRAIMGPSERIFSLVDDAWLLTPDEVKLFDEIPDYVPDGVAIAGNPWTGASLVYSYTGRPVLMPHVLQDLPPDTETIFDGLRDAKPGDATCQAIERTNTGYVLDFGDQQVNNADVTWPGLEDLADSGAVELVTQTGDDAKLYRITACDG